MLKINPLNIINHYLTYNSSTGIFLWKNHWNRPDLIGKVAGNVHKTHGYVIIVFNGTWYKAHHLAFLFMEGHLPEQEVDHIDGNRQNNSWNNLREVTRAENQQNRKISSNNSYNIKGLTYIPKKNLWLGQIQDKGIRYKKSSKNKELICTWLKEMRVTLHGEFANHG